MTYHVMSVKFHAKTSMMSVEMMKRCIPPIVAIENQTA